MLGLTIDIALGKKWKCICLIGAVMLFAISPSFSQSDTAYSKYPIFFTDFLNKVGTNNLLLASQKFNLGIAEANIEMASIFPDPIVNVGGFDNGQQRLKTGYGFSLGVTRTIETAGKRKARMNLANSQNDLAKALLEDFFRNLRADASINFLDALRQEKMLTVKINSYQNMKTLAEANQKRFELGAIMEIDVIQSKVEAGTFLNEVYQSEADFKSAMLGLGVFLGRQKGDTLYYPLEKSKSPDRNFELLTITTLALNNRADLIAAMRNKEVSRNVLDLIKANRVMNVDLFLYNNYYSRISNFIEPTPSYNSLGVGVAFPLKFSNRYAGDLKMAEFQVQQSDVLYQQAELQITVEVAKAYYQYLGARKQVQQFDLGLLAQSLKVLEGKVYSYRRGETSLLEVLNAQRNYNDTQLAYYNAMFQYSSSLVELERAVGIWDIEF